MGNVIPLQKPTEQGWDRFAFAPVEDVGSVDGWKTVDQTGESVMVVARDGRIIDVLREAITCYESLAATVESRDE